MDGNQIITRWRKTIVYSKKEGEIVHIIVISAIPLAKRHR